MIRYMQREHTNTHKNAFQMQTPRMQKCSVAEKENLQQQHFRSATPKVKAEVCGESGSDKRGMARCLAGWVIM
jgi:hypothetical protein